MSVKVKIPTQLRQLVGGAAVLEIDQASTLKELLEKVGADHPGLTERIMEEDGSVRRFVNIYVGDEDVRFLKGLDTELSEAATVSILPAVAGG